MKILLWLTVLLSPVTTLLGAPVAKVTPKDAARLVAEQKAVLIDVREPAEWADTGVAAPAVLLPKSDFDTKRDNWRPFLEKHRGDKLVLYCRSGSRAGAVAKALEKEGYDVANAGGFSDWKNAGLPVRPAAK